MTTFTDNDLLRVIDSAIARFAARCPRPIAVNQTQAAEMLGVSKSTVCKWIKQGRIALNNAGMIPMSEVDRLARPID